MCDYNNQYKELAKSYLEKHGHAILKHNTIKWTDLREVHRNSLSFPSNVKNKIQKLGYEATDKVTEEIKKLIFYDFPHTWQLFFITGKRYATYSDLDLDYSDQESSKTIYQGIHAYEMVYNAKEYFKSIEKNGVQIDVEIHGLDLHGNVNPYLKLHKSQIKSFHIG